MSKDVMGQLLVPKYIKIVKLIFGVTFPHEHFHKYVVLTKSILQPSKFFRSNMKNTRKSCLTKLGPYLLKSVK